MKMFSNILYSSVRRLAYVAGIAIALYASSALSSCSDDSGIIPTPEAKEGCFITVTVPMQDAGSRAEGDDTFNEFTVKTLDLFFYKSDGFDEINSQAAYHRRVNVDFVRSQEVPVNIPKKEMDGIFGTNGTKCVLYAVANYPKDLNGSKATPNQLQNLTVGPNFETTKVQESFAMISDKAEVNLDRTAKRATGSLTLTRACAKLMLSLDIPESIEVTNTVTDTGSGTETETKVTYISNPEAARVWITNGVKTSNIVKEIKDDTSIDKVNYYKNNFDTTEGNGSSFETIETTSRYKYVQSIPFYSYPNKWDPKSAEGATIITFQIPWHKEGETNQIITYYSITVNPDECRLLRNYIYDMRVIVSRLGSTDITAPVDMNVEWNYELPWNSHNLPVNIKDIRYLLLNNNDYDSTNDYPTTDKSLKGWYVYKMNNETELSIPVSTSHKVKIDKVEMIWHDFYENKDNREELEYSPNGNSAGKYTSTDKYIAGTDYLGVDFDISTSTLNIKRDLYDVKPDNTPAQSKPTYTPMYINVYISHEDDPSYAQKVRIEQYPPIYISAQFTSTGDYQFVDGNNAQPHGFNNDNTAWGRGRDVWSSVVGDIYLGSVQRMKSDNETIVTTNNINAHTYIISISKLSKDHPYIVADPRETTVNNLLYNSYPNYTNVNWSRSDSKNNRISNYYPASSKLSPDYVAPKLRIASQWGVTDPKSGQKGGTNYDLDATRRCAAYQENGRPAGRWRLPTVAEVKFIADLSKNKYIPTLFGNDDYPDYTYPYYCASGVVVVDYEDKDKNKPRVNIGYGTENNISVRCVYDEWYWGNDTLEKADKNKFVWGDRPRTTSGNVNKTIKR